MSETKPNNPKLFQVGPQVIVHPSGRRETINESAPSTDITLRDVFAAFALAGALAYPQGDGEPADYAVNAYSYADAMLAERGRK